MTDGWNGFGGGRERSFGRPAVRLGAGWQMPESHLLPDAVVAFVDGELTPRAHERASEHVARCPGCAAEVAAQRQVRTAMHSCDSPAMPAGLLASLRSIPQNTELPSAPDNLAVTDDGQLVTVQRPDRVTLGGARFGDSAPLGSATPLGAAALGDSRRGARRTAQGAGVVVSGLVLSALALVVAAEEGPEQRPGGPSARGSSINAPVARAQFSSGGDSAPATTPASTSVPAVSTAVTASAQR